ncbi:MAG: RluA family pseudouridine synthase, partial [Saprospiraceae bacterium]|nr:RluA family pseudouridine synthase [Saprospiraceae bacterium]
RLGLVHRIDKDTSGLLVVAKTEEAMNHLAKQFFKHSIYRRYWALVWGEPEEEEGTIQNRIGRHPKNRLINSVYDEDMEGGKWAVTHYKVLERLYYVSLIECNLETGRTHQIRVHMSDMGHPIFSDVRYGGKEIRKGTIFSNYKKFVQNCFKVMPRQALHARSLGFVHPRTEEYMQFEADLPEDFQQVLDKWRQYVDHRKELL